MKNVKCPICENNNTNRISNIGQFGFSTNVSICPNDGLVYLNPRWTKEKYNLFYSNYYDSYYRTMNNQTEGYNHGEEIYLRLNSNNINKPSSILDIGAGMGWVLDYLNKNYDSCKSIAAVETSTICNKHLKDNIGCNNVSSSFDKMTTDFSKSKYDLIVIRHVFEHTLDPINFLDNVKKLLSKNGKIYIAVPNMMNISGPLHLFWFRAVHTFYFSKNTLLAIMSIAGFKHLSIVEDNDELWGIFINDNFEKPFYIKNVFHEQMSIFKNYRKKYFYRDCFELIKIVLLLIIPRFFHNYLKIKYSLIKKLINKN